MAKVTLTHLTDILDSETSAINLLNANADAIATAFENTLSRDGTTPNTMAASLDMNSNRILNLPVPIADTEPVRFFEFKTANGDAAALATAVTNAQASATSAASHDTSSAAHDTASATSATNAATSATSAATSATSAASSLSSLLTSLPWSNTRNAQTGNYTVLTSDFGKTIASSGSTSTLTAPAASGFASNFAFMVVNESSSAGLKMAINGITPFFLWPLQSIIIFNQNNNWVLHPQAQRYRKANQTIYVDASLGDDANDGLAAGAGRALRTIQQAVGVVYSQLDTQASPPTIQLADGTYNVGAGVNINYTIQGSQLLITGNVSNSANVIVSCTGGANCFNVRDGTATVTLRGMTLSTTGNGSTLISCSQSGVCDLINVNFNAAPLGVHVSVATWASVNFLSGYSINGAASVHVSASANAYVNYGSFTVTGAASMAFTTFLQALDGAVITAGGVPMGFAGFSGFTGLQYTVIYNGVLHHAGAVIPGSGTTVNTGGQAAA